MNTKVASILMGMIIVASTAIGLAVYDRLPAQVVSHWNMVGAADGSMSRFWGVFLIPIMMAAFAGILALLPAIDPLGNIARFRGVYNLFVLFTELFFLYVFVLIIVWNLGYHFDFGRTLAPAIGALLFAFGVLLPKTKRNWFAGIRTPWTISSDHVWKKTHELGGRLFMVAGVIACLGALSSQYDFLAVILPLVVVTVWLVIYSYVIFRREASK